MSKPIKIGALEGDNALFFHLISRSSTKSLENFLSERPEFNVNIKDPSSGETAIIKASRSKNVGIVKMMIERKAKVNEMINGRTPLMFACEKGSEGCASALLEAGADINIKNARGESAFVLATLRHCPLLITRVVGMHLRNVITIEPEILEEALASAKKEGRSEDIVDKINNAKRSRSKYLASSSASSSSFSSSSAAASSAFAASGAGGGDIFMSGEDKVAAPSSKAKKRSRGKRDDDVEDAARALLSFFADSSSPEKKAR